MTTAEAVRPADWTPSSASDNREGRWPGVGPIPLDRSTLSPGAVFLAVFQACGLVRLTSYRTGQVVRYAVSGAATVYER